jgi:uncharacterized protein YbjT (DUF2867 family)
MASTKSILVSGATGKQGGALIKQLLAAQPDPPFQILALTRSTTSAKAQALASEPNVSLVEGNLDDCDAIFTKTGPVWGVFSVQSPIVSGASVVTEEKQGKALVDAAVANGVQYFVYTSVDRGGPKSDEDPTNIPHFISKFRVEKHLIEKAATANMGWTILRPTAFFDNFTADLVGRVFTAAYRQMGDKKLQFIASTDIGHFAAEAFRHPEENNKQSISLAGDDISFPEAIEIFKEEFGHPMPVAFGIFGILFRYMISDVRKMFTWFETVGYGANVGELRKQHPALLDFRHWLRAESAFKKQ